MKTFFLTIIFSLMLTNVSLAAYKGSAQTGQVGFWHSSTINRIQIGWDERIYIYLNKKHKCYEKGSDLIFYHPEAKGRQMVLSALLATESSREVNFRIDSCQITGNGLIYGFFDKMEFKL